MIRGGAGKLKGKGARRRQWRALRRYVRDDFWASLFVAETADEIILAYYNARILAEGATFH